MPEKQSGTVLPAVHNNLLLIYIQKDVFAMRNILLKSLTSMRRLWRIDNGFKGNAVRKSIIPGKSLILSFIVSFVLAIPVNGDGIQLKVVLSSVPGGEVLLAHYYGSSVLVYDTIRLDGSGTGALSRDTLLPEGIYKIYLNQETHFDFLLGRDQKLTITNPDLTMQGMQISGSFESEEFLAYMKWIGEYQKQRKQLEDRKSAVGTEDLKEIDAELERMHNSVREYWKRIDKEHPGTFLAAFLMSNYQIELDEESIPQEIRSNDSLNWVFQYNFRKKHYFDNFDLSDERFLYTPSIKNRLDVYYEKILLQMYDSIKPAAYDMIRLVEPHPRMFRYVVSYLLNYSLSSRVMGMDALFVDLAKDFYLSGRAAWADSTTLAKIRENVIFFENGLIGMQARDFQMETFEGEPFRLYQNKAAFTILAFFEPDCSHCRDYMPRLYRDIYLKYRDYDVDVVAVYTMNNKKEWADFIDKYGIHEWHNVWDEHQLTRFKVNYDLRTTPAVFLLDKDKKILAKKFTVDFLREYIPYLLTGL